MSYILIIGLNPKAAPVAMRQKITFPDDLVRKFSRKNSFLSWITEHIILSTKNRVEIYATTPDIEKGINALTDFISDTHGIHRKELEKFIFLKQGKEAVDHILHVTSSLDSLVIGDPHIHDQVNLAFKQASRNGNIGPILSKLFSSTVTVAERVRTETMIGDRSVSISALTVELAHKIFTNLQDKTILIIGTGELCELVTRLFITHRVSRVTVTHPNPQRAQEMAQLLVAKALPFERYMDAIDLADIIITSSSLPECLIHYSEVSRIIKSRRNRPMLFIDLGIPEDVDERINSIENVYLYDVIDLQNISEKKEVDKAESMVEEEVSKFYDWFRSLGTAPKHSSLRTKIKDIGKKEFRKAHTAFSMPLELEGRIAKSLTSIFISKLNKLVIGSRKSKLALWQADWVKSRLEREYSNLRVDLKTVTTSGDMILNPLYELGGKGLFLKEIEKALLDGRIDLAVHSTKDVPTLFAPGLSVPCFTKREDPRDALISKKGQKLENLPHKARIGTSSLRRKSQILYFRPDIEILPLRGNIDTRIKKLETQELDAIILAVAGLQRQGLIDWVTEILPIDICLPAVGQGALAVETRVDDRRTSEFISCLNDHETYLAVSAERGFLRRLEGGCRTPVAAHAYLEDGDILIEGMVASIDGKEMIRKSSKGKPDKAETLGIELAETILSLGGDRILKESYKQDL
jgi:hydroxymethylbilane synthase